MKQELETEKERLTRHLRGQEVLLKQEHDEALAAVRAEQERALRDQATALRRDLQESLKNHESSADANIRLLEANSQAVLKDCRAYQGKVRELEEKRRLLEAQHAEDAAMLERM